METHADTPVIKCLIDSNYLHGHAEGGGTLLSCEVYGISSYKDHYPTFKILVEGVYLFDYIPIQALTSRVQTSSELLPFGNNLMDKLYYKKACPDDLIVVIVHKHLEDKEFHSFFPAEDKKGGFWLRGKYLFSLDWNRSNQSAVFLELENGSYALVPNHKVKMYKGDEKDLTLPLFKKIRVEWKPSL